MTHPYADLPARAFWRTAVAKPGAKGISSLWQPKWPVQRSHVIATAGSCFAQHIGRAMSARGYGWTDFEPAPPLLRAADAHRFNYGVFSFRTANIYTPKMLNQWLDLALDGAEGAAPFVLENGRCVDPMRPMIEPDGFATRAEFDAARQATAAALKDAITNADIFVFTLGLTECWRDAKTGFEYAACPGTSAGTFDPKQHRFHTMHFAEIHVELSRAMDRMRAQNWKLRFLLTVSPVPLTATASGMHVLTATTQSKSVLRSVAGEICAERPEVDYFPSYEIVTSPVFAGKAFAPNMRSVTPDAVDQVMARFFADQAAAFPEIFAAELEVEQKAQKAEMRQARRAARAQKSEPFADVSNASKEDVACEEAMLDAFAK